MALRAIRHIPLDSAPGQAFDGFTLDAHDRHMRRKLLVTEAGRLDVLVDLPRPVFVGDGDHLELEDGRFVEVLAAEEDLYEIRGASPRHVVALAWQLGNRHLPAQLEWDRILIKRDPVIRDMLVQLHAQVAEVREQFFPEQGAYAAHGPFGHGH
jgi:urease accessory protein